MKRGLLKTGVEGIRRVLYLIPAQPEIAQIEITNRCNFNCAMCQRVPLKVPIKDMGLKIFKKIVDKLTGIEDVILTGWGEPLLHPQIIEMIRYAKDKNKHVSLTSNGSLLTKDTAEKLLTAGLDTISFSVDDIKAPKIGSLVHPITTQIKNIKKFIEISKNSRTKPTVIIQSTLHKGREGKILEVVWWASKIGADMVNVNRLDMRFQTHLKRPALNDEKKFIKKLNQAGEKYKIQTEFRPHIAFSGLSRTFYQLLAPYMGRGGRHCLRVYNYIYLNMHGEVTPCCALPLWSLGNILEEDLQTIWHNDKFQQFRQHKFQRKICGKCDVLETKQWA